MEMLSLPELKKIEFDLLKYFDAFCRKHKIKYFLSNGTLLGAVKYKGFIPWDDDIDVFVPREDYDKLISLFEDDDKFQLMSFERVPSYLFPFAKLCDRTTLKEEVGVDNGVKLGVNMDVFPLDMWENDIDAAKKEVKRIRRSIFCLTMAKLKKSDSKNVLKRFAKRLIMICSKIIGGRRFVKSIDKASRKTRAEKSNYVGCKSWCIYGEREIVPAHVFNSVIDVEFEGGVFPAPVGYDVYLKSLYGDYKKDPPPEKQKTHHGYTAYSVS